MNHLLYAENDATLVPTEMSAMRRKNLFVVVEMTSKMIVSGQM